MPLCGQIKAQSEGNISVVVERLERGLLPFGMRGSGSIIASVLACAPRREKLDIGSNHVYRRALNAIPVLISSELDIAENCHLVALFGVAGDSFAQAAPCRYVVEIGLTFAV